MASCTTVSEHTSNVFTYYLPPLLALPILLSMTSTLQLRPGEALGNRLTNELLLAPAPKEDACNGSRNDSGDSGTPLAPFLYATSLAEIARPSPMSTRSGTPHRNCTTNSTSTLLTTGQNCKPRGAESARSEAKSRACQKSPCCTTISTPGKSGYASCGIIPTPREDSSSLVSLAYAKDTRCFTSKALGLCSGSFPAIRAAPSVAPFGTFSFATQPYQQVTTQIGVAITTLRRKQIYSTTQFGNETCLCVNDVARYFVSIGVTSDEAESWRAWAAAYIDMELEECPTSTHALLLQQAKEQARASTMA